MWQHIHQLTGCSFWHKEFMLLDRVSGSDSFQVRAGPRRRRSNSSSNQWHTSGNKYLLTAGFHCQIQISFQKIMQRIIASIQIPFCVQHGILTTIYMYYLVH